MKLYWIKTNSIIKRLFSNYVWDIPNNENKVYLTFDDGPTPKITNWVLSQLKTYNAKATFFCIGKNIMQNPEIYQNIINDEHSVGNHTFNHLNGWKTKNHNYINNILKINQFKTIANQKIFRPPYGKIKPLQARELQKTGYRIIMWDVLSADFDIYISREKCLNNVLKNLKSGSIIVFHDSEKAFKNLEYVLPATLEYLKLNGFVCESI